jgi:hypothetical protein
MRAITAVNWAENRANGQVGENLRQPSAANYRNHPHASWIIRHGITAQHAGGMPSCHSNDEVEK